MSEQIELDVRTLVPRERHARIFQMVDDLAVGNSILLINDHDPKPLYYQLMAERPGQIGWDYVESGPEVWKVTISKTA